MRRAKRRAHHAADQLRNQRVIRCTPEGHHDFGARAIPSGRKRHLEKHDAHNGIVLNLRGVDFADFVAAGRDIAFFLEAVGELSFREPAVHFLKNVNRLRQVRARQFLLRAVLDLYDKHRLDCRA